MVETVWSLGQACCQWPSPLLYWWWHRSSQMFQRINFLLRFMNIGTAKATQEFLETKKWTSQSPGLHSVDHAFCSFKTDFSFFFLLFIEIGKLHIKPNNNLKQNSQPSMTEDCCSQGLVELHQGGNPGFGDLLLVPDFRQSFSKYWKWAFYLWSC